MKSHSAAEYDGRALLCPVCGWETLKTALTHVYQSPRTEREYTFRLLKCARCGLGFLDPQPDWKFLSSEVYNANYSEYSTAWTEPTFSPLAAALARSFPHTFLRLIPKEAGRALDAGCGNGYWMHRLAKLGWEVSGLDVSEVAVERVKSLGFEARCDNIETAKLGEESFDLVVFSAVLEHLRDPKSALLNAWRALRPGGRLILNVPNFGSVEFEMFKDSWSLFAIGHLFYFTSKSLAELLQRTSFLPEILTTRSLEPNFGWSLAGVMGLPSRLAHMTGTLALPLEFLLDRLNQSGELFCRAKKNPSNLGSTSPRMISPERRRDNP